MNSCGALCTYSLYDKQVNGAGAWRKERFIKPFIALTPEEGYFTNRGNSFAPDCDSPLDTLLELCN